LSSPNLDVLTAPIRDMVHYRGAPLLAAESLVREIDRYLVDAGTRPVHISELTERFKVHRRALQRFLASRRSPSCAASDSVMCTGPS
jgi:ActR/RegA family two-component response regulator